MMNNEKLVGSSFGDVVDGQLSDDIINQEYGNLSSFDERNLYEVDLEPINRFSRRELLDCERQRQDFNTQIEGFFKSDDEDFTDDEEEFYIVEYPGEMDVFDDLGDTSYMDQGIFEGADTDCLEEPFRHSYYEGFLNQDWHDYGFDGFEGFMEDYDKSMDFIDVSGIPDDLAIDEPAGDYMEELITERLFEEMCLDGIFAEIMQRERYLEELIAWKMACDEKIRKFT